MAARKKVSITVGQQVGNTTGDGDKYWSAMIESLQTASEINHPSHYNANGSGVEAIDVLEWMNFNIGNAVKYLWRCDEGKDDPITNLEKAAWYINREIALRKKLLAQNPNGTE
jgi:hypothetical protein